MEWNNLGHQTDNQESSVQDIQERNIRLHAWMEGSPECRFAAAAASFVSSDNTTKTSVVMC
jgi:hypothetical protein